MDISSRGFRAAYLDGELAPGEKGPLFTSVRVGRGSRRGTRILEGPEARRLECSRAKL
jgi:hypothetical protein